jgi:hypothetical protein
MNPTKTTGTRISFRTTAEKKKYLEETAGKNGMELSELIRLRLNDLPIVNQKLKSEFFQFMLDMTAEINKVGVNINQITAGFNRHLKCMEWASAVESIGEFNRLFAIYQQTLDKIYYRLNELIKNE